MPISADAVHVFLGASTIAALLYGINQRHAYQRTLERLSANQHLQEELRHKERLASIGRLAAGVAHEIGNPVTGIACLAQNLRDPEGVDDIAASADDILKQTRRIDRIVSSLVQFSHGGGLSEPVVCRACNVADCVDEAIHLLSLDRHASSDGFHNSCDRELLVRGDSQLLLQVFVNLLDNARWATPPGGRVEISAQQSGDAVRIQVDNPGEPIPPKILAEVFEPFFTTKDVGEGTGLGLALVRSMLEDMGGDIDIVSPRPAGDGARAVLRMDVASYDDAPTAFGDTPSNH